MKKELLLGAAYYLEYMPYDRLEEDLKLMKAAGFNVIRIAESTWSTWEPEDNVFDFTLLDRMLDGAKKYDLQVIIGTPTYAVPAWLVKKHPQVLAETRNGRGLYGPRQIMDITDPMFRFYGERIIRKVIEHTAGHPCVIGFQIDNETKHYGTASAEVQKAFVEYLKEKFRTTDNLNKAFNLAYWSNSVHRWEDFPDVRGTINGGLAGEFEKFQRKLAADYLHWQSDIVKEYKREDQFIVHNMDIARLDQFVKDGGVLVSSFKSFMCNEYLSVYPDSLPHNMTQCFGMSYDQFTAPGTAAVKGHPVTGFAELLKVDGGTSLANYEHKYWGRYGAMTKNDYGKGKAYYMGCYTSKDVLKELYRQAAADAGIEIPDLSWPLIMRSGSFDDGRQVHFLLNYSQTEQTVTCPFEHAVNILDNKEYKKGDTIALKDWDVVILER